ETLADMRRLGDALAGAGPKEEMGVVGLSLQLAARAPSESFVFLVGERPCIVCWGYEKEAANALLPSVLARVPMRQPVLQPPGPRLPVRPPVRIIPWVRTLLVALPLLLLLVGAAWLLRELMPAPPELALATREGPPAPPAPEPPPDPLPALKAAFSTEQSRGKVLQVELSLIEAELKKRIADCKPVEVPKEPPKGAPKPAAGGGPPPAAASTTTHRSASAAAATTAQSQRQSPAPSHGTDQRLFLHDRLLAHRSVPS